LAITPFHEVTPGTEAVTAAQPQKHKRRLPQSESNATQGNGARNGNGGVIDQHQRQQEEQQLNDLLCVCETNGGGLGVLNKTC